MTRVVNLRRESYDIYIGRPPKGHFWGYGNPFEIGRDGNRVEVVNKFRLWLQKGETFGNIEATHERRIWILVHLSELEGQRLGCFCAPELCHGNVYLEMLETASHIKRPRKKF